VPGRDPGSSDPGSPPHPLRRLRRSGRIRRTITGRPMSSFLSWNFRPSLGPLFRVSPGTSPPARRRSRSVSPRLVRSLRFGREMPLSRRVPPSWFLPPRRFAPFPASSMSQLAPDLGFARLIPRRSLVLRGLSTPFHLGPCAGGSCAPCPSKGCSSSVAVPHHCGLLPSCRSSPAPTALATGFGFSPRGPKSVGGACPLRLRRPQRFFCVQRMGQRISLWDLPGASTTRLPGCTGTDRVGAGRISVIGSPSRVRSTRGCGPPLRFPSRGRVARPDRSGALLEVGLSCSFSPLAGGRWREVPRFPTNRGPLDLRSLVRAPRGACSEGRRTRSSMDLRLRGGSFRSLAAPVAPSPSVPRALRPGPADFRVLLHRRVQSNPEVCCNFRVHCSFLGFVSPPRLSPGIAWTPRGAPLSDRGLPRSHPGPGFQCGPALAVGIAPIGWFRTLARFRLFDSGGRVRRRARPPWGSERQRATVTT
jgi:hypothetical protein